MWFSLKAFFSRFRNPFSQSDAIAKLNQRLAQKLNSEEVNEKKIREKLTQSERDLEDLPESYLETVEKEIGEEERLLALTNRIIENEDLEVLYDVREPIKVVEDYMERYEFVNADDYLERVLEVAVKQVENDIGYLDDMNVTFKKISENYRGLDSLTENIQRRSNYKKKLNKKTRELKYRIEEGNAEESDIQELCQYCIERIKVASEMIALATVVQKKLLEQAEEIEQDLSDKEIQERRKLEERLQQYEKENERRLKEEKKDGKRVRRYLRKVYKRLAKLRKKYSFSNKERMKNEAQELQNKLEKQSEKILELPDNFTQDELDKYQEQITELQNILSQLRENAYGRKSETGPYTVYSQRATSAIRKYKHEDASLTEAREKILKLKKLLRNQSSHPRTEHLESLLPANATVADYLPFRALIYKIRNRYGDKTLRRIIRGIEKDHSEYRETVMDLLPEILPYFVILKVIGWYGKRSFQ